MEETTPIGNPDAFDQRAASEYPTYRQSSTFEYDPGVFVLPLASHRPKTVTCRVHGGLGMRRVEVVAAKRGAPPILPAAVDTDKDTLINCTVTVPLPAISGSSATFDWVVQGTYLYVTTHEDGPRIPGRDFLPAGQYPFPTPLQDRAIEAIAAGGGGVAEAASNLRETIPTGCFIWPFTVMPPQFFNPVLLRDDDQDDTGTEE